MKYNIKKVYRTKDQLPPPDVAVVGYYRFPIEVKLVFLDGRREEDWWHSTKSGIESVDVPDEWCLWDEPTEDTYFENNVHEIIEIDDKTVINEEYWYIMSYCECTKGRPVEKKVKVNDSGVYYSEIHLCLNPECGKIITYCPIKESNWFEDKIFCNDCHSFTSHVVEKIDDFDRRDYVKTCKECNNKATNWWE